MPMRNKSRSGWDHRTADKERATAHAISVEEEHRRIVPRR
jgi:plasmid stability protein